MAQILAPLSQNQATPTPRGVCECPRVVGTKYPTPGAITTDLYSLPAPRAGSQGQAIRGAGCCGGSTVHSDAGLQAPEASAGEGVSVLTGRFCFSGCSDVSGTWPCWLLERDPFTQSRVLLFGWGTEGPPLNLGTSSIPAPHPQPLRFLVPPGLQLCLSLKPTGYFSFLLNQKKAANVTLQTGSHLSSRQQGHKAGFVFFHGEGPPKSK